MAYRSYSRRRSSGRSRYAPRRHPARRSRRRMTRRSAGAQRIVIQVIGGPGGQVPVAVTAGKKGKRSVRARY